MHAHSSSNTNIDYILIIEVTTPGPMALSIIWAPWTPSNVSSKYSISCFLLLQIFFLHPCNITSWRCVLSCRFAGFSLSHYTCGTMWAKGFSSPTGNPYPKANVSKPALEQRQLPTLLNSTNAATGFLHSDFHIQTRFVSHGNTLHVRTRVQRLRTRRSPFGKLPSPSGHKNWRRRIYFASTSGIGLGSCIIQRHLFVANLHADQCIAELALGTAVLPHEAAVIMWSRDLHYTVTLLAVGATGTGVRNTIPNPDYINAQHSDALIL